jgi:hypothetical protein
LLLVVGWSSVVMSLNITPRKYRRIPLDIVERYSSGGEELYTLYRREFGFPWTCVSTNCTEWSTEIEVVLLDWPGDDAPCPLRSVYVANYWAMVGNAAVGAATALALALVSKYLLNRIISAFSFGREKTG